MLLKERLLLSSCLVTLAASAAVKAPPATGWTNFAPKSAYSRALGPPPSGIDTISVPYMPKSPFFPKFVDPKTMISKKTDMLSNLFGGMGPAYPPNFKPFMPYGASEGSFYNAGEGSNVLPDKTSGLLLQDSGKTKISDGSGGYKRGMFGPFASTFGPMSPKFGPMSPFMGADAMPDYSMKGPFFRKRRSVDEPSITNLRSILGDGKTEIKDLGPPPAYPSLPPIAEEPEEGIDLMLKKMGGASVPKEYLPGMFAPFGPVVDPSMFMAKKSAFLDTLFKSIATSTASPTTTDIPVPKSTIVPPNFWFPTSIIPSPTEYNSKVSDFLDKLFDSLKLNKTGVEETDSFSSKSDFPGSVKPDVDVAQARISRSAEDLASIDAAKDTIVDTILTELNGLKADMMSTMDDLITYEKSASASPIPKKPFKPFAPGMWSKPVTDVMLPFKQRMAVLGQVFDMLTDLQKNITTAVQNIVKAKTAPLNAETLSNVNSPFVSSDNVLPSNSPINVSFLDAIKNKLATLDTTVPTSYTIADKFGPKKVRMLPKSPTSFWVSYPEEPTSGIKREVDENSENALTPEENESGHHNERQYARAVKMQMHQGYQSLPAGSIESVQAGGGSVPGHQGGGIKLLESSGYGDAEKWADWVNYLQNEHQGHRHHNHH